MSSLDVLLDTTWSLYYVHSSQYQASSPTLLHIILTSPTTDEEEFDEELRQLSHNCRDYLLSQTAAPVDDLNDESKKQGVLQGCTISRLRKSSIPAANARIASHRQSQSQSVGLFIELRFQKVVFYVVLFCSSTGTTTSTLPDGGDEHTRAYMCPVSLLLCKAPATYVKQIAGWLDMKLHIPQFLPLRLSPELILEVCSQYLGNLSDGWTFTTGESGALEQAVVQKVLGNLRLMVSVTDTAKAEGVAGKLRTVDLDVPHGTVYNILERAAVRRRSVSEDLSNGGGSSGGRAGTLAFLDELAEAIHLRTGLRLPLKMQELVHTEIAAQGGHSQAMPTEPPLRITRISCAAFAIGTDGRIKLAGRPVEDAEAVGYDEELVRKANWKVLELVQEQAERRGNEQSAGG